MTKISTPKTTAGVHCGPSGSRGGAGVRDRLDHPDDEAADHRAPEVADAAHDRRGKRDQASREALVEADRPVVKRVDESSRAGHQAAEQERQLDRAVNVDPH